MSYPFDRTWWIHESALLGGRYPGSPDLDDVKATVAALIDHGFTSIVNLQEPTETGHGSKPFPDYEPLVRALAAERGCDVLVHRFPIPDQRVPDAATMVQILDTIDQALAAGHRVYVHCWGGNGRTGTVAGCWLVRHGHTHEQAIAQMRSARQGRGFRYPAPESTRQHALVKAWHQQDPHVHAAQVKDSHKPRDGSSQPVAMQQQPDDADPASMRVRATGALLGLALGDALGTTVEFKAPGSFKPLTHIVGGGPFHLKPGQWTDDTSMALCLAQSLVLCEGFDPHDQMQRYCRWWLEGHFSATGQCFDIGTTILQALARFKQTGQVYAGSTATHAAGNGSLMRLAPVAIGVRRDSSRHTEACNANGQAQIERTQRRSSDLPRAPASRAPYPQAESIRLLARGLRQRCPRDACK